MNRSPRREDGQSTVEFALVLPLVIVVVLLVVQVLALVYGELMAEHLAREIARALVVAPDADLGILTDALGGAEPNDLGLVVEFGVLPGTEHEVVCVTISRPPTVIFGLFSTFFDGYQVEAAVKMLVE